MWMYGLKKKRFWNICLCFNLGTLGWEFNNSTLTSIPMNSLCIHHILLLLLLVSNWVGWNDRVFASCHIGDKKNDDVILFYHNNKVYNNKFGSYLNFKVACFVLIFLPLWLRRIIKLIGVQPLMKT
jgi:uncharacterized SAM-binding protein YcdF (DUF218 family)